MHALLHRAIVVLTSLLLSAGGVCAQPRVYIDSLRRVLHNSLPDTARVKLLNAIGFKYTSLAPDTAQQYAARALQLARDLGWKRGIAHSYNILGSARVRQSDFPGASGYYNRSLEIFRSIRDTSGMLKAIGNLGVIDMFQANYVQGLQHDFEALSYAEALLDTPGIIINLSNIGALYEGTKDYDKGLVYHFRSLRLLNARRDSASIATSLGNVGNIYNDKKSYQQALRYQQQAHGIHERIGYKTDAARDLVNIGNIHSALGEYGDALRTYFRALDASGTEFLPLRGNVLNRLGATLVRIATDTLREPGALGLTATERAKFAIHGGRKDLAAAAIPYLLESVRIDSTLGNINSLQSSYEALSGAQRILGRHAEALASQDRYIRFKDSVFSLDNKAQIANLETKRELELKDKQIELDRLAVAKKRNERVFFIAGMLLLLAVAGFVFRNVRLRSAKELSENKLSAFQARMNPHFIFNSLNSIQSLVLSGETISSITYLSRFSKLMRQILDGSGRSKTLLQDELDMLRGYIELEQLRFDRFTFSIDIAPGINPAALEVPTMIIQPFVENAIIHGILPRRDAGLLRIAFERRGQTIVCIVDDNGIGRKRSQELNAARARDHRSQGISIATSRLALLGKRSAASAVQYVDKEAAGVAGGTTVILQIPLL